VLSGIEDDLLQEGVLFCTPWNRSMPFPVATISSHHNVKGVNRILLDQDRAAKIALEHLMELGHRRIAFIKGQTFVPDTQVRWNAITKVAAQMGLPILPKPVTQIEENSPSPRLGYRATQELLVSGEPFTALFAFNDICAMGVIRALHEFGLRVPEDVSVLGFDDIESAGYQTRGLTTVQQPLREMGKTAAQLVLRRILRSKEGPESPPVQLLFEPRLVVRETTAVLRRPSTSKKEAEV
jgi:LacI family transcriptional regulator